MHTITRNDQIASSTTLPAEAPVPRRRFGAVWIWLWRAIPTATVVGVLTGLAIWGHSTDWTLPKFSSLLGNGVEETDDWCQEHNVPESRCIECHVKLLPRDKNYGWCEKHGVAQCPLHHPDVAQLKQVPNIAPEAFRQAERALVLRPRAENNSRCKLHERRIQFASAEAAEKVGIDIDVVRQRPIVEAVVANGEIRYDETRMARLASRVAGTAWRVCTQVGDRVREGDVLALVDAAEVGKAKASFLQAITHVRHETTNVDQLKPLVPGGTVSGRQFREAEAALEDAQIVLHGAVQALTNLGFSVDAGEFSKASIDDISRHLRFLGLSDELLDRINTATSNLFPVKAPIDGVVVNRTLVAGEVVQTNSPLFSVADVEQMWLVLDVREEDVKFLSLGQRVLFRRTSGGDGPEVEGSLSWISTAVDDQTRTVEVRAELPNAGGRLRANSFGTGRIVLREEGRAVIVPTEAIHWDGCCHVVFVRDKNYLNADAPKFFHIRKVRPGVKDSGGTEIIVGLLPGEVIAAKNSVVLEAQLLKGNLGAGCGCGAD